MAQARRRVGSDGIADRANPRFGGVETDGRPGFAADERHTVTFVQVFGQTAPQFLMDHNIAGCAAEPANVIDTAFGQQGCMHLDAAARQQIDQLAFAPGPVPLPDGEADEVDGFPFDRQLDRRQRIDG